MPIENYNMSLMPPSFEPWSPKQDKSKQVAVLMSGGVEYTVSLDRRVTGSIEALVTTGTATLDVTWLRAIAG